MQNNENQVKRGRKPVAVNFNFAKNKPFTVGEVHNRFTSRGKTISKVAIAQKIAKLVRENVLCIVGTKIAGRGRPYIQYARVTA